MSQASRRNVSWPALLALVLVPLLAVGALLGLAGRGDSQASAAVVNLDEAVTLEGQYTPMGRQLAAAMVDRDGDNIEWTLADAPSAAAGLKSGKYSAVVTIPKEFSASATSFAKNEADAAQQATIQIQVSDNAPVTDAALAQEIARLATDTINSTLTRGYLDGIYVGFNTVGEQFTTIVDGAKQLNDGSTQLADGVEQATQGATQLSDGMLLLDENGATLADGGFELVAGIRELKSGSGQLSSGASELATGADQLADGVEQFAGQTPALVGGVNELAAGADQLLAPLPEFANGAAAAISGVTPIRDGLTQVITGLDQPQDYSDLQALKAGADGVAAGAAGLSSGLKQVNTQLSGLADPSSQTAQGAMQQVTDAILAQAAGANPGTPQDPCAALPPGMEAVCPILQQMAQEAAAAGQQAFEQGVRAGVQGGWQAGVGAGVQALNTADPTTKTTLTQGAEQLAGGAGQLADGVTQLVTELPKETAAQMETLKGGLTQIRDGANTLVTQAKPIVDNAPQIASGATQLNEGIKQLNSEIGALPAGVNQLSTGARQLSDGAAQLSTGVAQFDDGVGQLQTGAQTFADGVQQYTTGVAGASRGSTELTNGLVQLSDGAKQLDDGVGTFATELAKGADQVPTYSAQEREKLATVVAQPVEKTDDLIAGGRVPLVSLLLATGLWLGALASFVAMRPVPRNAISSRAPTVSLWARSVGVPAAIVAGQGLLLGLIGGLMLDVSAGKVLGLMALLAAFGVSFVLVNHALAAWLGNIGRGISVLLLVVTVALGLSSAANWLSPVGAVSPLQNGLELVRTMLSDGSGEIGLAATAVLMGAIALVASYVSIASKRSLTVAQYRKSA